MNIREIEHQSEQMQDDLDRRYLTSSMTDEEYSCKCAEIEAWERRVLGQYNLTSAVAEITSHYLNEV